MIGAFVGDINGSIYEYNNSPKSKDFIFWQSTMFYTDDSVATIAVMDAILKCYPFEYTDEGINNFKKQAINSFKTFVETYPDCGWGAHFYSWATNAFKNGYQPYNSFGNGAAMRISPVGWVAESVQDVKVLSKAVTEVTHNHPEGLKGAEATAMCIYLARMGKTKEEIKKYVLDNYYPEMNLLNYDSLIKTYEFDVSCQGTVPVAIHAFLISESFADCLKTAVAIGGDCDTLSCIACSIAEAFYLHKEYLSPFEEKVFEYLPENLGEIVRNFNAFLFRLSTQMGYLVVPENEDEFNRLINFLEISGVTVMPCKFDEKHYNAIAISEDRKFASKKTLLSFYGDAIKNNKVRIFKRVDNFISKFKA